MVCAVILGAILGCEDDFTAAEMDIEDAKLENLHATFDPQYLAYSDIQSRITSRSILTEGDTGPYDLIHKVEFNEKLSKKNMLELIKDISIPVTHAHFEDIETGLNGGISLYKSYYATEEEIDAILIKAITQIFPEDVDTSNIRFKSVQAVISDTNSILKDTRIKRVNKVFAEEVDEAEEQEIHLSRSTDYCGPNSHSIQVAANSADTEVNFVWNGKWSNSTYYDNVTSGPSPAIEPDLKLKFKTFLGIVTKGWVKINPLLNYVLYSSTLPDSYVDSQSSDGDERAYTIGSTSAEDLDQNTEYRSVLIVKRWNSDSSTYKQMEYKFQYWDSSLSIEGWAWSVGTLAGINEDFEDIYEDMGDISAPVNNSYTN